MELIPSKIDRFIRTGEGTFDSLALELFSYQFERNVPYQSYCRIQKLTPETVQRWQDIPAVPISAFKSVELATFPVARASALFESSQTTGIGPSRHYLKDLQFYETALKTSFEQWMLPDHARLPFFILTPPPGEAPRSSLTWMFDVVKRKWGTPDSRFFMARGRLDEWGLERALDKAQAAGSPVALMGTTIAFMALFDDLEKSGKSYTLPPGSRLLDTGGMKTQKRVVTRSEFIQKVQFNLGIPESSCVNEYGMCEMSSQFYGKGIETFLNAPAWVRTLVINPDSGREAPKGTEGLLRHYDLANVDSVMAIQTEDLGIVPSSSSDGGFLLLGRAPGAALKGCSLSAEAFVA